MSKKRNKDLIHFKYSSITTEQFAILDDVIIENNYNTFTNLTFGYSRSTESFLIKSRFELFHNDNRFIILETSSMFQLKENEWEDLKSDTAKKVTFPKPFVSHLCMLAVGSARGILHSKLEGTSYSSVIIPLIQIDKLVNGDLVLDLEKQEIT